MLNIRLLERIRKTEDAPGHRGAFDSNALLRSILEHLQRLLNTRQGNVPIAEDYGMPDFTNLIGNFATDSIRDLSLAIQQVVEKYEPRLRAVEVNLDEPADVGPALHFKIEARLATEDDRYVPVVFQTVIDPDGRVNVKP